MRTAGTGCGWKLVPSDAGGGQGLSRGLKREKKKGKIKSLPFGKMTRTGSSAGKEGRARIVSTAPLPCWGLRSLTGSERQERIERVSAAMSTLPAPVSAPQGAREVQQLIILAVIPAGWERLPGPAPPHRDRFNPVPTPPINRAPRHHPSPWQRHGPVDADGSCHGNTRPDDGVPGKGDRSWGGGGRGRGEGAELSQPHGHHLALGRQGHFGVPPLGPLQPYTLGWGPFFLPTLCIKHANKERGHPLAQQDPGAHPAPSTSLGRKRWGVRGGSVPPPGVLGAPQVPPCSIAEGVAPAGRTETPAGGTETPAGAPTGKQGGEEALHLPPPQMGMESTFCTLLRTPNPVPLPAPGASRRLPGARRARGQFPPP